MLGLNNKFHILAEEGSVDGASDARNKMRACTSLFRQFHKALIKSL